MELKAGGDAGFVLSLLGEWDSSEPHKLAFAGSTPAPATNLRGRLIKTPVLRLGMGPHERLPALQFVPGWFK